jgi:hypothetical protein
MNKLCKVTEGTSDNKNPTYYLSKISHPFPNIKFNNASTKETERIINSVDGYDGYKMPEVSSPYISSPLNYICNKSIRSGTFPTR